MREIALIGKKIGMTREFYKTGQSVPVTVIKMEKARVIQVIDSEKRGYKAVQLGYGKIKNSKLTKAMKGYFAKKNTEAKKKLKEFRVENVENFKEGNEFGLEITETAELEDIKKASESLGRLKNEGIKIALDDFGAGYASLKYIKDLPIDVVKLDRDFTSNIKDEATSKLVKFVAEVCDELKLEMIGEGIETEEEKNKMIDLGCTIGQGYLMHMPSFVDEFEIEK